MRGRVKGGRKVGRGGEGSSIGVAGERAPRKDQGA